MKKFVGNKTAATLFALAAFLALPLVSFAQTSSTDTTSTTSTSTTLPDQDTTTSVPAASGNNATSTPQGGVRAGVGGQGMLQGSFALALLAAGSAGLILAKKSRRNVK